MIQNCFSKDTFILTCIVLFCKWFFIKRRTLLFCTSLPLFYVFLINIILYLYFFILCMHNLKLFLKKTGTLSFFKESLLFITAI